MSIPNLSPICNIHFQNGQGSKHHNFASRHFFCPLHTILSRQEAWLIGRLIAVECLVPFVPRMLSSFMAYLVVCGSLKFSCSNSSTILWPVRLPYTLGLIGVVVASVRRGAIEFCPISCHNSPDVGLNGMTSASFFLPTTLSLVEQFFMSTAEPLQA